MNDNTPDVPRILEVAVLGGGCFWCLEAVFRELRGVEMVGSGYAGGQLENPTYKQVCTGDTGHAEVVEIMFRSDLISFRNLLVVFFHSHDPTTLNQQGPDTGTQYRSIILFQSDEQRTTAEEVKAELMAEGLWGKPFVTEIVPSTGFHMAEESHQDYYRRNPDKGYCSTIISPKILKLRKLFSDRLKEHGNAEDSL